MSNPNESPTKELSSQPKPKSIIGKMVVLGIVVVFAGVLYWFFRDALTLQALAAREDELRAAKDANPWFALAIAFVVYVVVAGLALPGAAALSVVYGWLFGFRDTIILVSFASTIGATLSFLLSRYLFREAIQSKFRPQLLKFNKALEREGAFYLFTLRLIPAVPFFIINVVMGLTPIKTWTFYWVSQIGMFAGTCVFVYAGSTAPRLQEIADKGVGGILKWQTLLAFVILGLFPLVIKNIMSQLRPSNDDVSGKEKVDSKPLSEVDP
ncbi:MAG: putative membrane protein YdjX (TVP38/TMEM64 family) [Pirellulaceae bacterium]